LVISFLVKGIKIIHGRKKKGKMPSCVDVLKQMQARQLPLEPRFYESPFCQGLAYTPPLHSFDKVTTIPPFRSYVLPEHIKAHFLLFQDQWLEFTDPDANPVEEDANTWMVPFEAARHKVHAPLDSAQAVRLQTTRKAPPPPQKIKLPERPWEDDQRWASKETDQRWASKETDAAVESPTNWFGWFLILMLLLLFAAAMWFTSTLRHTGNRLDGSLQSPWAQSQTRTR
jgi:hypothetical protein